MTNESLSNQPNKKLIERIQFNFRLNIIVAESRNKYIRQFTLFVVRIIIKNIIFWNVHFLDFESADMTSFHPETKIKPSSHYVSSLVRLWYYSTCNNARLELFTVLVLCFDSNEWCLKIVFTVGFKDISSFCLGLNTDPYLAT